MSVLLKCSDLYVGYGSRAVLENVDLELASGEVLALLGPNGGGKSTLLKTLSGLVPRIKGSVDIEGEELSKLNPRCIANKVAFVPQDEPWQFEFTVSEIVAMGRIPRSNGFFDNEEDRQAAGSAMERAGCERLQERLCSELSGGERQRVLIARALAQETPIIFLDEPTSHLDPRFQVEIVDLIRQLAMAGKAIVVAVHDLTIAGQVADRGVLIYDGRASAVSPIAELLNGPELDRAYGAGFERILSPEGRLIVIAKGSKPS